MVAHSFFLSCGNGICSSSDCNARFAARVYDFRLFDCVNRRQPQIAFNHCCNRFWTESPRNFTLGVGMDSIKRYAKDWRLFDDGRLPMGHFHSTPVQLLVERGFPALLLWLWILYLYGRTLVQGITNYKLQITDSEDRDQNSKFKIQNSKLELGILFGCFGGLIGFVASGFVHYNLGDAEVVMIFFLLMGLAVKLVQQSK
jgi:hypothetical protein